VARRRAGVPAQQPRQPVNIDSKGFALPSNLPRGFHRFGLEKRFRPKCPGGFLRFRVRVSFTYGQEFTRSYSETPLWSNSRFEGSVPCPNLVLSSLELSAHAFQALESSRHAGEELPCCPVTSSGSSGAVNGRAGEEEYQVKARYQVRANPLLDRMAGS